jgi:glycosyltransferase involved in cell wall biosynthesis
LQRYAFGKSDAVVAVSRSLRDELGRRRFSPARVELIQNVLPPADDRLSRLEARSLLNLPDTGPIAGWVGRLSQEKAPDLFVEALQQTDGSLVGCVVGDGPMRPLLEDRICDGDCRVRLCESVPDARRLMPAFNLLVLSSRTEATPLVLLEAIDAEIPVVATRVGGIPDLLDADSGLLVESGDAVGLRMAIIKVIQDPDSAASRARNARKKLEALYDFEAWVKRHAELYHEVTAAGEVPDSRQTAGGA